MAAAEAQFGGARQVDAKRVAQGIGDGQSTIGGAQEAEAGEQIVDCDERHDVVAAGIDQLALAAVFDNVLREGEREGVECARDRLVSAGRDGTRRIEVVLMLGAGEVRLHALADLRMEGGTGLDLNGIVGA